MRAPSEQWCPAYSGRGDVSWASERCMKEQAVKELGTGAGWLRSPQIQMGPLQGTSLCSHRGSPEPRGTCPHPAPLDVWMSQGNVAFFSSSHAIKTNFKGKLRLVPNEGSCLESELKYFISSLNFCSIRLVASRVLLNHFS